jgi:hypothetical protein
VLESQAAGADDHISAQTSNSVGDRAW